MNLGKAEAVEFKTQEEKPSQANDKEKTASERFQEKRERLIQMVEGSLAEKVAVYRGIQEEVSRRKDENKPFVSSLGIYQWIIKDAKKAQEYDLKGEILNHSQTFLETVEKNNSLQRIDEGELSAFLEQLNGCLNRVSSNQDSLEATEAIRLVLRERTLELLHAPEQAESIILALISSLKAIFNKHYQLQNQYAIQEREIKGKILPHYLRELQEKAPEQRQIMSNVDGRINGITFVISQSKQHFETSDPSETKDIYPDSYITILSFMKGKQGEKDCTVKCVYESEDQKSSLLEYLKNEKLQYPPPQLLFIRAGDITERDKGSYTQWVRDGAVRRNDGSIVEPKSFYSPGTSMIYENLVPVEGTDIEQSELYFQGGNMRTTESFLFIGSDDIRWSMFQTQNPHQPLFIYREDNKSFLQSDELQALMDQKLPEIVQKFEQEFGKKVIVIGSIGEKTQDIFHIDMAITPLDDTTVMVGEARNEHHGEFLNNTAQHLANEGFKVVRLPYQFIPSGGLNGTYVTYNNALIERYTNETGTEIKRVYLPQYFEGSLEESSYDYEGVDLEKMNREAADIYRAQGFEVIPIQVSVRTIERHGSLNCLTFEDRVER